MFISLIRIKEFLVISINRCPVLCSNVSTFYETIIWHSNPFQIRSQKPQQKCVALSRLQSEETVSPSWFVDQKREVGYLEECYTFPAEQLSLSRVSWNAHAAIASRAFHVHKNNRIMHLYFLAPKRVHSHRTNCLRNNGDKLLISRYTW